MLGRLAALLLLGVALGCQRQPKVQRVIPGIESGNFSELSESALATLVICHDTLGRPTGPDRVIAASRCTPCLPIGLQGSFERLRAHGQKLWMQSARAPYDSLDATAGCIRLAYKSAQLLRPDHDSTLVELALFNLAAAHDSTRAAALFTLDSALQSKQGESSDGPASLLLGQLALGMWDRAQRQMERPQELDEHRTELRMHRLAEVSPPLKALPRIPRASSELGESEAEWAARLFETAAIRTSRTADRSRWLRLALSPWVVMERWSSLDSAAAAMLRRAPNDSALVPARALAAFKQMKQPVIESPSVMAMFDSVVRSIPRPDSLRYDALDGVLSQSDDDWRYGFLPDERRDLDRRGWAVIDPLWSTRVNEIQLARRARIAEADFRYADVAYAGESGSETKAGIMLLRLGVPTPRWGVWRSSYNSRRWIMRGWSSMTAVAELDDTQDTWRVFYGTRLNSANIPSFPVPDDSPCVNAEREVFSNLFFCASARPAAWDSVPFLGRMASMDVALARFRAVGDSADIYIGARMPLRGFKAKNDGDAAPTDRITMGVWLTSETGLPIFHADSARPLPDANTLFWTQQWRHRVGSLQMMHRVEGIEPSRPSGARGVAQFTSDAQVSFSLRGFGMSDVLVSSLLPEAKGRRWSDLQLRTTGGAITPKERFTMVWEVYDLTPGPDGRVRWRVRIRREQGRFVTQSNMQRVLSGAASAGSRVVADESDAPDVSYTRDEPAAKVVLNQLNFHLGDAPVGRHVVNVTVDDLVSGKSVTRGVSIRVYVPESERRAAVPFRFR